MNNQKKILILAYFFPPCNLTGSYRVYSFAKYLHLFGYYPIVITRKWDHPISELKDMSMPVGGEIIIEKHETYEVHYLPYWGNLKDKIYIKYGDNRFVFIRKILSLWELVFRNYFNSVVPFHNIYDYASDYLKNNKDIKLILTSGLPYILFRFCYLLNRKHHIKWIADYRDEWTSNEWNQDFNRSQRLINRLESSSEKKWLKTAACTTTVSELWAKNLQNFLNIPSFTIFNGYDEDDYNLVEPIPLNNEFTIIYNGSLYYRQEIEIFLDGFKLFLSEFNDCYPVKLIFLGMGFDPIASKRVKAALVGYERYYTITGRISKNNVIETQIRSHLFLLIPPNNISGCTTSKIFEYFACNKNILLCPGDNDIEEELIRKTHTGFIANTSSEVSDLLRKLVKEYYQTGENQYLPNKKEIEFFTRKNQTKHLSLIMDRYL